jgi:CRP/FNR family transcriptional regulator
MTVSNDVTDEFAAQFPLFRRHPELTAALLIRARRQEVPPQTHLYWEGDSCAGIAFLLAGEIRVYKCAESGQREITLYEIGPGETCILNASCILGNNAYPANAVTTATSTLVIVPAHDFKSLLDSDGTMRAFVFTLLSQRLTEVMALVNEVAFGRLDERLEDYLVEKSADGVLAATHQKISNDLGTSREVVSRLLKDFERQGRVLLARNEIRLVDGPTQAI